MPATRLVGGYLCLVGLPLLVLILMLNFGAHGNVAGAAAVPAGPPAAEGAPFVSGGFLVALQIIVILLATRVASAAARRVGQPGVIGEMVAGIVLGPSLLGWLAPWFTAAVFPKSSLGHLEVLSQLGLVLFMFLVGASLDTQALRGHCHAAILTSHVSIVMPLVLGAALASLLYPALAGPGVGFIPFALFMGAAMSITAFPVLARILSDRNLLRSRVGTLAIACAAVDDVTGWCILAYITVLIRAPRFAIPIWLTIAGAAAFGLFMIFVARPFLRRYEGRFDERPGSDHTLAATLLFVLGSSLTTEFLGLHLLFGSFLAGAVMPKGPNVLTFVQRRLEPFCLAVLMPLFFAFTGLRTNLGLLQTGNLWAVFALIAAVAIAGKLGGATAAARLAGLSWREAGAVGSLLNTRGLMELVILNIGLEVGILTPALFTLMVMMAILTTLMTAPMLRLLQPPSPARVRMRYDESEPSVERAAG